MTKDRFREALNINGGQFDFFTEKHEGMIGVSPTKIVIWVDGTGYSKKAEETEPKNIGEYESVDELLGNFRVDGGIFADNVLPEITKLNKLLS